VTFTSVAAVFMGPARIVMAQHYTDHRNITFAEMAAALRGTIWSFRDILDQPTTLTVYTDSGSISHSCKRDGAHSLSLIPSSGSICEDVRIEK
jgi:hypothetical protein